MKANFAELLLRKVRSDYQMIADEFSASRGGVWPEFQEFMPYLKPGQRLLDVGCGNGRVAKMFETVKVEYTGLDVSSRLLEQARKLFPRYRFIEGSILNVPEPDQSADVVWCIAVIHQIPSDRLRRQAARELLRILKPGGVLCLTVWNLRRPPYLAQLRWNAFKSVLGISPLDRGDVLVRWRQSDVRQYYHAFTESELARLLREAGFQIERTFFTRSLKKAGTRSSDNLAVIARRPNG